MSVSSFLCSPPFSSTDKLFEKAVVDQVPHSLFSGRRFIFTTLLKQPRSVKQILSNSKQWRCHLDGGSKHFPCCCDFLLKFFRKNKEGSHFISRFSDTHLADLFPTHFSFDSVPHPSADIICHSIKQASLHLCQKVPGLKLDLTEFYDDLRFRFNRVRGFVSESVVRGILQQIGSHCVISVVDKCKHELSIMCPVDSMFRKLTTCSLLGSLSVGKSVSWEYNQLAIETAFVFVGMFLFLFVHMFSVLLTSCLSTVCLLSKSVLSALIFAMPVVRSSPFVVVPSTMVLQKFVVLLSSLLTAPLKSSNVLIITMVGSKPRFLLAMLFTLFRQVRHRRLL